MAVDPGTHKVYVSNSYGMSVIDGATNTVIKQLSFNTMMYWVAVDPGTHTVYVTHSGGSGVTMIDGTTDTVTATIDTEWKGYGVAVDPVTHRVYVSNYRGDTGPGRVTVLDGLSHRIIARITVDGFPIGVAVDPVTRTVYVGNPGNNTVSTIDASTNTVTDTIAAGSDGYGVAVDPGLHTAYVSGVRVITQTLLSQTQPQTIRFTSEPPAHLVEGMTYRVRAVGGASAKPVTFSIDASSTAGACRVDDLGDSTGRVHFTGVGSCVIAADQAAGVGYDAAPRARQPVQVEPAVVTPRSGTAQATAAGQPFRAPLVAAVTDALGYPARWAPVTFTITEGSATMQGQRMTTVTANGAGIATAPTLTAGDRPGPVRVAVTSGSGSGVFPESVTGTGREQADLSAKLLVVASSRAGSELSVRVAVHNEGPEAAQKPRTAVTVPPGFRITGTGAGTRYGSTVLFPWPDMIAPRTTRTYTFTVIAPAVTTPEATFRAATISTTRDSNLGNNTTTATIRVS